MPPSPALAVVVPVKGGLLAKTRLALAEPDRQALADAFARDCVDAVRHAAPVLRVVVVTADPAVRSWAHRAGCHVVADPGGGLDAAVAGGLRAAAASGAGRAAVLLADHPALSHADAAVLAGLPAGTVVPDAEGSGTALLVVDLTTAPPWPTAFGPGSAAAHARLGYRVVEPHAPGLRTDVDDAAALAAAVALGVGAHTRAALARVTLPPVQATIHRPPGGEGDGAGSVLLDDGVSVLVPLSAVADSGLLHLRVGQRVSVELDESGRRATRVWLTGIGPGETIR